jgi:hypothetical protein
MSPGHALRQIGEEIREKVSRHARVVKEKNENLVASGQDASRNPAE